MSEIPKSLGKDTIVHRNGDTDDIIAVILLAEQRYQSYGKEFAKWATANFEPTKVGLGKLWEYVHHEIEYKVDPAGKQYIKTPPALAEMRVGDCKSKTLFVNAVLRSLGIDYKIRFTSYQIMDSTPKHVYTIADLDGQKIVLDTVHTSFNKEVGYSHKKDYAMPDIHLIEGLENASCTPQLDAVQQAYMEGKSEAAKRVEEIRQKQEYIPIFEPVDFHKLNEGQANLQLLEREIKIIMQMQPEKAAGAEKMLNLLHQASRKGDFCITGDVAPEMYRYAAAIERAATLKRRANSFGTATKLANALRKKGTFVCPGNPSIGSTFQYPGRICLNHVWKRKDANGNITQTFSQQADGTCTDGVNLMGNLLDNVTPDPYNYTQAQWEELRRNTKFHYGIDTPYAVSFADYGIQVDNIQRLAAVRGNITSQQGNSYVVNNKSQYEALMIDLNENSGVTSNWVNETFSTKAGQGSVGSGMLYNFAGQIPLAAVSGFLPVSNLPTQVQVKKAIQDAYMGSCQSFSGVSEANMKQLARQGVLFDNAEQPEDTIAQLYRISQGDTSGLGIGILDPATITLLVTLAVKIIAGIIAAAASSATRAADGAADASILDATLAASNQFRPPGLENGASDSDFPLEADKEKDSDSTNSLLLPLAVAAAGVAYAMNSED